MYDLLVCTPFHRNSIVNRKAISILTGAFLCSLLQSLLHSMGATLHGHGHSHSSTSSPNGSSHSHGSEENINVRAAFIHVLSDFVQSLGVFIAALVIYFKPEWNIIDPICTFLFSILVLGTTIAIMKDALLVSSLPVCRGICIAVIRQYCCPSILLGATR